MAAAQQPMVRVRCPTIHGPRPGFKLLSARSEHFRGNLKSISYQAHFKWLFSIVATQKYASLRNHFVICIDSASADDSPRLIQLPASWKPVNALTTTGGWFKFKLPS
jgi:hypothetical protein